MPLPNDHITFDRASAHSFITRLPPCALDDLLSDLSTIQDVAVSLDLIGTLIDAEVPSAGCAVDLDRAQVGALMRTFHAVLSERAASASHLVRLDR